MQYMCDPLRMCPLKSHRTPGPASDHIGQPYKHPNLDNGPKDLVLRMFPYLSFFIKGEVATYLATKNVALLFSRVKTLNLGNPHSTMVVWLWILSVSNYCTRISPSCDVMIHPFVWPYGDMSHPRLPTIHRSHWGAQSTMTASKPMNNIRSSNWIWKTSDLITRADTGQPANGEQWQRVSNTLIRTASSQCITISSQKDHNVSLFLFRSTQHSGNIHTLYVLINSCSAPELSQPAPNSLFYIYLRGPSPSAWMILSKKPAFTGILGGKWLRLFDIYAAAKYYIDK